MGRSLPDNPEAEPGTRERKSRWAQQRLLYHRDFRLLWAGDAISQFGTMVTLLALPLLAVRTLHASEFEVGVLTTFETLGFLLVGLPAGAWVDRMRRREVMVTADIGRAVLLASLPLAAFYDALTLSQLYAVALAHGVLTVFFDVSYQSYLPSLVGRDHLVEANSKLQGTQSVAQLAGPTTGGLLVQALTAPYALLLNVFSLLWSASCLRTIAYSEPVPQPSAKRDLRREIQEGLAFVLRHRLLRSIAACTATANLFAAATQAMMLVLLARDLNLSAGTIGLLYSTMAVGGLVGALLARRVAEWVGQGPAIWLSVAIPAPFAVIQPFVHRNWTLGVLAVASVVLGAGTVIYNVTQVSFRQALCPDRLLGRMNATMRFLVWGTMPLGGLLGGAIGSLAGVRTAILVGVIGGSLAFLPVFFSPLRTMRTLPGAVEDDPEPAAA